MATRKVSTAQQVSNSLELIGQSAETIESLSRGVREMEQEIDAELEA